MARLTGLLASAAIVLTAVAVSAQTPVQAQGQQARLVGSGSIHGVVIDDRGGPLAGAMVSALGVATLMVTTDARGRFVIQPLPSGEYVLRIHSPGFVSTRRDGVRVGGATADVSRIQLHRVDGPLAARPILAAGVVPSGENAAPEDDNHSETAWR